MKISPEGIQFLMKEEGTENRIYRDTKKLLTIGVGHLLTKSELSSGKIKIDNQYIKYANGLTNNEVLKLFDQDLDETELFVLQNVTVPLKQHEFDMLVSLCFNIGMGAFKKSTLLKLLNQGKYSEVPDQFLKWKYSGGEPVLLERRKREVKVWKNGY